ncbi:hypothetical protein [Endozoicomonas sp. 2B-B]
MSTWSSAGFDVACHSDLPTSKATNNIGTAGLTSGQKPGTRQSAVQSLPKMWQWIEWKEILYSVDTLSSIVVWHKALCKSVI